MKDKNDKSKKATITIMIMKISASAIALLGLLSTMGAFGEGFIPSRHHSTSRAFSVVGSTNSLSRIGRGGGGGRTDDDGVELKMTTGDSEILPVYAAKTISSFDKYKKLHAESIADPAKYWGELAKTTLDWMVPFDETKVLQGDLTNGNVAWFAGGKLNVAYNALDRHDPDALALIWEGDEPDDIRKLTFGEMSNKVSQIANALKAKGVKKGDVVTIYMPMIPELAMTMLACAKIGAVHSVVFAGFSSEALASRIQAAKSEVLVTADHGLRGGKNIALKFIVDSALEHITDKELVKNVLVWERNYIEGSEEAPYSMKPHDVRMDPLVADQRPYCAPEPMDAEDNLFILYTSGKYLFFF